MTKKRLHHPCPGILMTTLLCFFALLLIFNSAYAADAVKIGIIGPMQIRPGIAIKQGAIMAADEINAKGGILGRKIELHYADTEFSPEKGITALNKLAVKDKVEVLIGGMTSGIVLAQMPYLSRYQLPFLGVAVASSTLTKLVKENYDKNKYFFRVGILKDQLLAFDMVNFMANYVGKKYGIKKVAILLEKAKWTEGLDQAFTGLFGKFGMEVVMAEFFEIKTNDYSPIFSKVKKSGAQMTIEVHSHVSEVFIKQYYDQKVPLPVGGIALAAQSSDFWERSGGNAWANLHPILFTESPLHPRPSPSGTGM